MFWHYQIVFHGYCRDSRMYGEYVIHTRDGNKQRQLCCFGYRPQVHRPLEAKLRTLLMALQLLEYKIHINGREVGEFELKIVSGQDAVSCISKYHGELSHIITKILRQYKGYNLVSCTDSKMVKLLEKK